MAEKYRKNIKMTVVILILPIITIKVSCPSTPTKSEIITTDRVEKNYRLSIKTHISIEINRLNNRIETDGFSYHTYTHNFLWH